MLTNLFNKNKKQTNTTSNENTENIYLLRDIIAPAYIEIDFKDLLINNTYYRTLIVTGYPRTVNNTWLSPLINYEDEITLSMFFYPITSDMIIKQLRRKIAELEASLSMQMQEGKVLDPREKVKLQDANTLIENVASGAEKFFNLTFYIRLKDTDKKRLDTKTKNVLATLSAIGVKATTATLRSDLAFHSTLPKSSDKIQHLKNMDTTALSQMFPFVSSELTMNQGILYGLNLHNSSLVIFDRFKMPNANEVVFATSGAGKSYYVKLQALRYLMLGVQVLIIDPDGEYEELAKAVDGKFITFSHDSKDKLNPFEFFTDADTENAGDVLRDKILSLHTFFKLMFGGQLNVAENAVLDKALVLTYKEKGITTDKSTWQNNPPLLEDLYKILLSMPEREAKTLANRLAPYVIGSAAGIFNKPTSIDANSHLVAFSIRDLRDELRPIAMYMILDYIWTKVRRKRVKRLLIVDEAWNLMQYEDSGKFLFGIAKRARKYYLGLTAISQDVDEFINSKFGKAVVTNASMRMLLKQSTAAIDIVQKTFDLSSGEKDFLLNARRGEGIFFAGKTHVAVRIISNNAEHRVITSDPNELAKLKKGEVTFDDIKESSQIFVS